VSPAAAPPLRRSRAFRWAAVAAPFVFLALAEGALRVFGPAEDDAAPHADRRLELTDARFFEPDPELFWRFLPGREFRLDDPAYPHFRTNALGLRGPDVPPERPRDAVRVICVGDSVTFGLGLRDGETFPERMEARLRDDVRLVGRDVRVVNAGTPGYGSVQGLRLLQRLERLRPDVVVWWFGMNDAKPAAVRDAQLRPSGGFAGALSDAVGGLRVVRAVRGLAAGDAADAVRVPPEDFREVLASLDALAARDGFTVLHVRCPNRLDEGLRELTEVVAAAEGCSADEVRAPYPVLSPWTPSPLPAPFRFSEESRPDGGKRVVVESEGLPSDRVATLAEVVRDREAVARWKTAVDRLTSLLPEKSVGDERLFGTTPRHEVMTDNCHLSSRGADLAGAALAAEVLSRLEAAGRIPRR